MASLHTPSVMTSGSGNTGTSSNLDRLSVVEAERAISILEDTVEKLSFLDSITPDILQHRDELSKFIGDEIARTLSEQHTLEGRYEGLIEQRSMLKGLVNKMRYREIQEEIQEVSRALRESTTSLVRSLKENPNISGNLIKVQRDRTELQDLLLRCVQELRDRGKFSTIIMKVDEERNGQIRLMELKERERMLRENVSKLQLKLNEAQIRFNEETNDRKKEILEKRSKLIETKTDTTINIDFYTRESDSNMQSTFRQFHLNERELESRVKLLEEKLFMEKQVSEKTREFLDMKHKQLTENIQQWEKKYDIELNEMENQIIIMNTNRNELLEKLNLLQERKNEDMIKNSIILEKKAYEKRCKEEEIELKRRQNKAALTIQSHMRLYIKRKRELDAIKAELKRLKAAKKAAKAKGKK